MNGYFIFTVNRNMKRPNNKNYNKPGIFLGKQEINGHD